MGLRRPPCTCSTQRRASTGSSTRSLRASIRAGPSGHPTAHGSRSSAGRRTGPDALPSSPWTICTRCRGGPRDALRARAMDRDVGTRQHTPARIPRSRGGHPCPLIRAPARTRRCPGRPRSRSAGSGQHRKAPLRGSLRRRLLGARARRRCGLGKLTKCIPSPSNRGIDQHGSTQAPRERDGREWYRELGDPRARRPAECGYPAR